MAPYVSAEPIQTNVNKAVEFLTHRLRYPTPVLSTLRAALIDSLIAHYAQSWDPTEPPRGSGRRCLTLSPESLPPRPIYTAMKAANVQWSEWIAALGGFEFDLCVDPGHVYRRRTISGFTEVRDIWSEEAEQKMKMDAFRRNQKEASAKTLAQQVMLADEDSEDEIFVMIADELREPTWMTPIHPTFPNTSYLTVPTTAATKTRSTVSNHSRSSSRSSNSSSGFSFSSVDTSDTSSVSSGTTVSSSSTQTSSKLSRRERARQARVFIDQSKTEVTNYDGGKTTVLTGGVMLGGRPPKPAAAPAPIQRTRPAMGPSFNWRATRV